MASYAVAGNGTKLIPAWLVEGKRAEAQAAIDRSEAAITALLDDHSPAALRRAQLARADAEAAVLEYRRMTA